MKHQEVVEFVKECKVRMVLLYIRVLLWCLEGRESILKRQAIWIIRLIVSFQQEWGVAQKRVVGESRLQDVEARLYFFLKLVTIMLSSRKSAIMNRWEWSEVDPLLVLEGWLWRSVLFASLYVRPKKLYERIQLLMFKESLLDVVIASLVLEVLFDFVNNKVLVINWRDCAVSIENISLLFQDFLPNDETLWWLLAVSLQQFLILKRVVSHSPLSSVFPEVFYPYHVPFVDISVLA